MTDIATIGNMTVKGSVIMEKIDIDRFCAELATSRFCPPDYKGNPVDIKFAILWGGELGLNAFQSITGIKIINGKPTLYGDIFLAVCKSNPAWEDMIETYDPATKTAYCEVRRKGHEPLTRSFSHAQATAAKLIKPAPSPWTLYPERMLQHRARGFALRDMFADSLCGMIDDTEAKDYPVKEVQEVKPVVEPQMRDHHVDYLKAELWQFKRTNDQRNVRGLLDGLDEEVKKRFWAALDAEDKSFVKECINNKPEVANV
jgi:hypothetical protein